MTNMFSLLAAFLLLSPGLARAAQHDPKCDLHNVGNLDLLTTELSNRAVQAVRLAQSSEPSNEARLLRLISPAATFSLGTGDVGRPLGTGMRGARALATEMNAETFRFDKWSGIPVRVADPCSQRDVNVEFTVPSRSEAFPVKFTFANGRIIKAAGWSTTFVAGMLNSETSPKLKVR